MSQISDLDLARFFERRLRLEPGEYHAPAARVVWDGVSRTLHLTGVPLDPAAALFSPRLAKHLALPVFHTPLPPSEPIIAALEADYSAATAQIQSPAGNVVPATLFATRLNEGCRKCPFWTESARQGRGRCQSVRCNCSRRLLWLTSETCPEGKWP